MTSIVAAAAAPLIGASEDGNYAAVAKKITQLSEICLNYQDRNKHNQTALMLACKNNHEACVEALLSARGLDVNISDDEKFTALMLASKAGLISIVGKLIAVATIKVNSISQDGATALFLAAEQGHQDVVKALLLHPDVDVNILGHQGQTALMVACAQGHINIVRLILSHPSVQLNVQDQDGNTALMIALDKSDQNCASCLIASTSLGLKNKAGHTALHLACRKGFLYIAVTLVHHASVDINAQDGLGMTPFMYALEHSNRELHMLFLNHHKFDARRKTKAGFTPLDFARDLFTRAHVEYLGVRTTYSWLAKRLLNAHFDSSLVLLCERCLVLNEGFSTEELFALVSPVKFHSNYLHRIGVEGLGLQTFLLRLHQELHAPTTSPLPPGTVSRPVPSAHSQPSALTLPCSEQTENSAVTLTETQASKQDQQKDEDDDTASEPRAAEHREKKGLKRKPELSIGQLMLKA